VGKKRLISRGFAVLLVSFYFGTNVAFAHVSESRFWDERRKNTRRVESPLLMAALPGNANLSTALRGLPAPERVTAALPPSISAQLPASEARRLSPVFAALSTQHGTVRRVSLPLKPAPGGKRRVVLHIQDVHQNADAQRNIGGAIQELIERQPVAFVALEGLFQPLSVDGYRAYPDRDAVAKAADYLLRDNGISGPVHAAMTGSAAFPSFIGVDDSVHHRANVEAYKRSAPRMAALRESLDERILSLSARKAAVFNPSLRSLDEAIQARRKGTLSLGDYVRVLGAHTPLSPQAALFLQAFEAESSINFKQVESERSLLVERLGKTLTRDQSRALMEDALSYRLGRLRFADFYRNLQSLCENNALPLSGFPSMKGYIRYVLLTDRLEAETLHREISSLEKSAVDALARTPEERALEEEDRKLHLTGKLLDFALSPEEWSEYQGGMKSNDSWGLGDLGSFESFYGEALARDAAMADNLLAALDRGGDSLSVLVTGGFHAPGLTERLTRNGCTVITYVPKIEIADGPQGPSYLSVFSQEKTPLEKIFQGETLFLAENPGKALPDAPPLVGAAEIWSQRDTENANEVLRRAVKGLSGSPLEVKNAVIAGDRVKADLLFTRDGEIKTVSIDIQFKKEGEIVTAAQAEGKKPSSWMVIPFAAMARAWSLYVAPPLEYALWLYALPSIGSEEKNAFVNQHRMHNASRFLRKLIGLELLAYAHHRSGIVSQIAAHHWWNRIFPEDSLMVGRGHPPAKSGGAAARSDLDPSNLSLYYKEISKYPLLSLAEELDLAARIQRGDQKAFKVLVQANLKFVVSVARHHEGKGVPLPELIQEGNLGLMRAAQRFDSGMNCKFISYAVWWINQRMLLALKERSGGPYNAKKMKEINLAYKKLSQRLGRGPSLDELSAESGFSEEEIFDARRIHGAVNPSSLDAPFGGGEGGLSYADVIADPETDQEEEPLQNGEKRELLEKVLPDLPEREAEVLRLYYLQPGPPSLRGVAAKMNLSPERVRQLRDKALSRLRHPARLSILKQLRNGEPSPAPKSAGAEPQALPGKRKGLPPSVQGLVLSHAQKQAETLEKIRHLKTREGFSIPEISREALVPRRDIEALYTGDTVREGVLESLNQAFEVLIRQAIPLEILKAGIREADRWGYGANFDEDRRLLNGNRWVGIKRRGDIAGKLRELKLLGGDDGLTLLPGGNPLALMGGGGLLGWPGAFYASVPEDAFFLKIFVISVGVLWESAVLLIAAPIFLLAHLRSPPEARAGLSRWFAAQHVFGFVGKSGRAIWLLPGSRSARAVNTFSRFLTGPFFFLSIAGFAVLLFSPLMPPGMLRCFLHAGEWFLAAAVSMHWAYDLWAFLTGKPLAMIKKADFLHVYHREAFLPALWEAVEQQRTLGRAEEAVLMDRIKTRRLQALLMDHQDARDEAARMVKDLLQDKPFEKKKAKGKKTSVGKKEALLWNRSTVKKIEALPGDLRAGGPVDPGLFRLPFVVELEKRLGRNNHALWRAERNVLVASNLKMVMSWARYYHSPHTDLFPDLMNQGFIGLVMATYTFDGRPGIKFSTYAAWWIKERILNYINRTGSAYMIHLPPAKASNRAKVMKTYKEMSARPDFSWESLAAALGLPLKTIHEIISFSQPAASLDAPVQGNESGRTILADLIPDSSQRGDPSLNVKAFEEAINGVLTDERERKVIRLNFGLFGEKKLSLERIGSLLGIGRARAGQIKDAAMAHLTAASGRSRFQDLFVSPEDREPGAPGHDREALDLPARFPPSAPQHFPSERGAAEWRFPIIFIAPLLFLPVFWIIPEAPAALSAGFFLFLVRLRKGSPLAFSSSAPEEEARLLAGKLFLTSGPAALPSSSGLREALELIPEPLPLLKEGSSIRNEEKTRFNRAFQEEVEKRLGRRGSAGEVVRLALFALRAESPASDYETALKPGKAGNNEGLLILVDSSIPDLNGLLEKTLRHSQTKRIFWAAADEDTRKRLNAVLIRHHLPDSAAILRPALEPSHGNGREFDPEAAELLIAREQLLKDLRSWSIVLPDGWIVREKWFSLESRFRNAVFLFLSQTLDLLRVRVFLLKEIQGDVILARKLAQFA
jgi:RNA polymerase primary sigma factor